MQAAYGLAWRTPTMTKPTIRVVADAEAVSRTAAEDFVRLAREAIGARGQFVVALSGGSTPKRLFQILAEPPFRDQVDWSRVELFWGDERSLPPDHNDSNFHMATEALLKKVPVPATRVHRLQADRADRDAAARDYQVEIARVFHVDADGPPPRFDLVLLGMGPDGHTASLFPQTAALKETKRWVVANYVPKFTTHRLTLTAPVLNAAANVYFLAAGADKTGMLADVVEGKPDPDRLPSQMVRPTSGNLVWLVDRAAAAGLKQSTT